MFECFPNSTKLDFSDFYTVYPNKNLEEYRALAYAYRFGNKTERQNIFNKYGIRWAELHRLPYFNAFRFTCIDPMHNLFLGTSKRMLEKAWLSTNKIDSKQLKSIQKVIDSIPIPSDIGRIPHKIASGFAGFTADQWKTWVLVYSTCALSDVLEEEDRKCWQHFVNCIALWSQRIVTINEVDQGEECMLAFLREAENLYSERLITPNMHYHTHLRECILDYGPFYSFWCFAYERMNG